MRFLEVQLKTELPNAREIGVGHGSDLSEVRCWMSSRCGGPSDQTLHRPRPRFAHTASRPQTLSHLRWKIRTCSRPPQYQCPETIPGKIKRFTALNSIRSSAAVIVNALIRYRAARTRCRHAL